MLLHESRLHCHEEPIREAQFLQNKQIFEACFNLGSGLMKWTVDLLAFSLICKPKVTQ